MALSSDYQKVAAGVVNGTIGTVENIQPSLITVKHLKNNELMCITRVKRYVSLRHCIDTSIREQVQGMTISSNVFVVLDSTFFASGQAYVALSRVTKSAQLHLLAFDPDNAIIVFNNVRSLYGLQPLVQSNAVRVEPTSSCIHPETIQPSPLVPVLSQM